jgi:hypothetical protein
VGHAQQAHQAGGVELPDNFPFNFNAGGAGDLDDGAHAENPLNRQ